jgi:hypothetical protein
MQMHAAVAIALAVAFAALAALHLYWAARGSSGADGSGAVPTRADGTPLFRPGRASTLAVAAALGAAALVVLGRSGPWPMAGPAWIYRAGAWTVGAVLLLRTIGDFRYVGLFKRERESRFAVLDTRYFTPLCAALAAGTLYLAAR